MVLEVGDMVGPSTVIAAGDIVCPIVSMHVGNSVEDSEGAAVVEEAAVGVARGKPNAYKLPSRAVWNWSPKDLEQSFQR
jgi:hypothetical protein